MTRFPALLLGCLALAGCASGAEFDSTGGIKITRSSCPAVAVPAYTGDITLFNPPQSRDARALDVVATITNVRSTCDSSADPMRAVVTFDVQARRAGAGPAREVVLPYFATVMRGGSAIVSKQLGRIAVQFAEGQDRATASGQASAEVSRAAATLPEDVLKQITRKRKPGDADAAIDPMADPAIRSAVQSASFELLVGFQLSQDQLAYNATR